MPTLQSLKWTKETSRFNMISYQLNKIEQEICLLEAKSRVQRAVDNGFRAKLHSGDNREASQLRIDLEGSAAEWACARILNICPDFGTFEGDIDLIHPSLGKIDVKATPYQTGRLLVSPTKNGSGANTYVLMIGDTHNFRYTLAGFCPYQDVFNPNNLEKWHGKGTHTIRQEHLQNLGTFTERTEE